VISDNLLSIGVETINGMQYHSRDIDLKALIVVLTFAAGAGAAAFAQNASSAGQSLPLNPIVLLDSTGKVAARPLTDTMMLVAINESGVVAPAFIRPIYDADTRTNSGLATWQSGGSALFTSSDCTNGAYIHSLSTAGVRATTQVQTPSGIMLYVGAIGTTTTVAVHSILYDNGCSPVTVQQNGLLPVEATLNLTTAYPPPLSFQ